MRPALTINGRHALIELAHVDQRAFLEKFRWISPKTAVKPNASTMRMTLRFSHVAFTCGVSHAQPASTIPISRAEVDACCHLSRQIPSASRPSVTICATTASAALTLNSRFENSRLIQNAVSTIEKTASMVADDSQFMCVVAGSILKGIPTLLAAANSVLRLRHNRLTPIE